MDQRLILLAACLNSRDACAAIGAAGIIKDDVGRIVLKAGTDYYARDPEAVHIDRGLLAGLIKAEAVHVKAAEPVVECLQQLPEGVSGANVGAMIRAEHLREARLRLATALAGNQADVSVEMDALRRAEAPASVAANITQLRAEDLIKSCAERVPIYPAMLNGVFAGGLAPGHTVIVFGRPGAGKTLVVVNIGVGFLYSGKTVLHIMNEESQEALTMRYLSLMVLTQHGELQNLTHYEAARREKCIRFCMQVVGETSKDELTKLGVSAHLRNFKNLHIAHGVYSYTQVRELVRKLKPDLVIIDQVRHFGRGGDDPLHASLERVTQDLRAHAHEAGFTGIGVTQAGASAEGKPVLDLADIDGAKTGLQGACDAIIGLGKGPEDEQRKQRVMSICRNKISGTITHFPVGIDVQHTRILDPGA
jgi:KaiC/GvpD/RAD55 family RecA-like ATPase